MHAPETDMRRQEDLVTLTELEKRIFVASRGSGRCLILQG